MVNDKHMIRQNVFFFIDVTPMTAMHSAGEGGPPLTLSYLEVKQFEPIGLHPGGKILPPLRLDDPSSDPKTVASQVPSVEEQAAVTLPIHTALTSTALGGALDGAKNDPMEIARRLHVNRGHASAQPLKRTIAEADELIPWRSNSSKQLKR